MGSRPFQIKTLAGAARLVVEGALTVTLALFAGNAVWLFFGSANSVPLSDTEPSAQQTGFSSEAPETRDLMVLIDNNPFISEERAIANVDSEALNAPETGLNLTLQGVRAIGDGTGTAFITLPDGQQVRASVGDELLDGVDLEYVFADRVTLRTRGELETLYRRDETAGSSITSVSASDAGGPGNRSGAATPAPRGAPTLEDWAVDPEDLMRGISLSIMRDEEGDRSGYLIAPRGDENVMLDAGLQPGDIVRGVNGRQIAQIDAEELQELILSASKIDFDVERDGETERVSVFFTGGVGQ